eukprot:UN03718
MFEVIRINETKMEEMTKKASKSTDMFASELEELKAKTSRSSRNYCEC